MPEVDWLDSIMVIKEAHALKDPIVVDIGSMILWRVDMRTNLMIFVMASLLTGLALVMVNIIPW